VGLGVEFENGGQIEEDSRSQHHYAVVCDNMYVNVVNTRALALQLFVAMLSASRCGACVADDALDPQTLKAAFIPT
jgi:hypothetical protein